MSRLNGEQLVRLISVALLGGVAVLLYVLGPEAAQTPAAGALTGAVVIAGGAMRRPS